MDPFPNFDLVPGAFGDFDGVLRSQFFQVHVEHISSIKNLEIHNPPII